MKAMDYELAGNTKVSAKSAKKYHLKEMDEIATPSIVWYLVKRHKLFILGLGNVLLVLNWAIPEWFGIVKSLLAGL